MLSVYVNLTGFFYLQDLTSTHISMTLMARDRENEAAMEWKEGAKECLPFLVE